MLGQSVCPWKEPKCLWTPPSTEGAAHTQADRATTTTESILMHPGLGATTIEGKKTTCRKEEGRVSKKEEHKRLYQLYPVRYNCILGFTISLPFPF